MKRMIVFLMIVLSVALLSSCNKTCKDFPLPPDETMNNQTTTTTTTSQTTTTTFSTKKIKKIVEEDLQIKLPIDTKNLYFSKTYYGENEYENIWGYAAKFSLSEDGYNKLSKSFKKPSPKNDKFTYNSIKNKHKMCFTSDFKDIKFLKRCFASARLTETIYVKTIERRGWLAKSDDEYILYTHCYISKEGEYHT